MFLPPPSPVTAVQYTNRLLAALEPEDLARLEPHLELVNLTLKQVLYETGTPSPMPTSRMTRSSRWSTSWRMGTRLRSACLGARG